MMKRLIFLILLIGLLPLGCMPMEEIPRPTEAELEDGQTHHYHPVHAEHLDWNAGELGRTLKIHAEDESIRLSVRTNPRRVVIRRGGVIIGSVERNGDVLEIFPPHDPVKAHPSLGSEYAMTFRCLPGRRGLLTAGTARARFVISDSSVQQEALTVKILEGRGRYSISHRQPHLDKENACTGIKVESPFSPLGTAIFHSDDFNLAARSAIAWFLTIFDEGCSDEATVI